MLDATDTRPDIDPDRASFTIALNTARDQLVHAAGVVAGTVIDLVGVIGAQVLAHLLPGHRPTHRQSHHQPTTSSAPTLDTYHNALTERRWVWTVSTTLSDIQ